MVGKGPTRMPLGSPGGSEGKASVRNVGDLGSIPGEGKGYPLQYSGLELACEMSAIVW